MSKELEPSEVTIIKHRHDRFTIVPRAVTNGQGKEGLSLKATGLLCHLLGKPDDWKTYVNQIIKDFPDGKTAIWSGLRELRAIGYAKLDVLRDQQGRITGRVWRISDQPDFCLQKQSPGTVTQVFPVTENPCCGKPTASETGSLQKTDLEQKTELIKKTNTVGVAESKSGAVAPSSKAEAFIAIWEMDYQAWHGVIYKVSKSDRIESRKLFEDYPKAKPRDFKWLARVMWIATRDQDEPITKKADGSYQQDYLFHSVKGQWSLDYYCRKMQKIVREQGESLSNLIGRTRDQEVEKLDEVIKAGREKEDKRSGSRQPKPGFH